MDPMESENDKDSKQILGAIYSPENSFLQTSAKTHHAKIQNQV